MKFFNCISLKYYFALIFFAVFAFYSVSLNYGLTFLDDNVLTSETNTKLDSIRDIYRIFKSDVFFNTDGMASPYYRPILNLSFSADAYIRNKTINHPQYSVFHLTNILLHCAAVCMVFYTFLLLKIERLPAMAFTLLFAIHPSVSISVAWLPGRNDILLCIFFLTCFISLLKYCENRNINLPILYFMSFVMALFTKETAVVIPVIFLCYLMIFNRNMFNEKKQIFLFSFLNIFPILLLLYMRFNAALIHPRVNIAGTVKNILFTPALIGKALLPINTSLSVVDFEVLLMPYFLVFILFLLFTLKIINKDLVKNYIFGILWVVLIIMPGMLVSSNSKFALMDHRLYIPIIGIMICLSAINIKKIKKTVLTVLFSIFFLVCSYINVANMKNKYVFWTADFLGKENIEGLADIESSNGFYKLAEKHYYLALDYKRHSENIFYKMALAKLRLGNLRDGYTYLKKEVETNPGNQEAKKLFDDLQKAIFYQAKDNKNTDKR